MSVSRTSAPRTAPISRPTSAPVAAASKKAANAEASTAPSKLSSVAPDVLTQASERPTRAATDSLEKVLQPQSSGELGRVGSGSKEKMLLGRLQKGFQRQMRNLAKRDPGALRAILQQSFGNKIDPGTLDRLTDQALGEFPLPATVKFVDPETLKGANGAYSPKDGGTIFINRDLAGDAQALQAVFNEEMGHHLDQQLGGADSIGDEGELFQKGLARGGPLDAAEAGRIRGDQDAGTITVDGKKLEVEFQQLGSVTDGVLDDFAKNQKAAKGGKTSRTSSRLSRSLKNVGRSLAKALEHGDKKQLGQIREMLADVKSELFEVRKAAGFPPGGLKANEHKAKMAAKILNGFSESGLGKPEAFIDNVLKPLFGSQTTFLLGALRDMQDFGAGRGDLQALHAPLNARRKQEVGRNREKILQKLAQNLPAYERIAANGGQFEREVTSVLLRNSLQDLRKHFGKAGSDGQVEFPDARVKGLYQRIKASTEKIELAELGRTGEGIVSQFRRKNVDQFDAGDQMSALLRKMRMGFDTTRATHPPQFKNPEAQRVYTSLYVQLVGAAQAQKEGIDLSSPELKHLQKADGIDPKKVLVKDDRGPRGPLMA